MIHFFSNGFIHSAVTTSRFGYLGYSLCPSASPISTERNPSSALFRQSVRLSQRLICVTLLKQISFQSFNCHVNNPANAITLFILKIAT